jgi:serine/threonine-protein kinase
MLAVLAAFLLTTWSPRQSNTRRAPLRLSTELGVDASLVIDQGPAAVISPDDTLLAFVAQQTESELSLLYVRRLEELRATLLPGTEGARNPFFSSDGQSIGFFAGGKLKRVSIAGGPVITLCDAPNGRGGAWTDDGTIVFAPSATGPVNASLLRVASTGGTPQSFTKLGPGEITHKWPQVLPGGTHILYSANTQATSYENSNLVVQELKTGTRKIIRSGGYFARYVASGHIVFMQAGALFAAPFDLRRLEITAPAVPVLENINGLGGGTAQFAVSDRGTLVYLPGESLPLDQPIIWMTREGKMRPLRTDPTKWSSPHFSPDGRQLAIAMISNVKHGHASRLTLRMIVIPYGRLMASASRSVRAARRDPVFTGNGPTELVRPSA